MLFNNVVVSIDIIKLTWTNYFINLSIPLPTGDILLTSEISEIMSIFSGRSVLGIGFGKTEIIDDVVPPDIFTPKTEFVSDSTPHQKTGIKSVDDKNYEDYLKVLQIYRPDLFIDKEENYIIPTPKNEIIETEDVVPPAPPKLIRVIPQEKPIP